MKAADLPSSSKKPTARTPQPDHKAAARDNEPPNCRASQWWEAQCRRTIWNLYQR